jgi:ankyrin repeat protein
MKRSIERYRVGKAVVKLLLDNGAEVDSKDIEYGGTPLSWAAEKGHEAVVRLLLDNGAEVDSKDKSAQTLLSWAAESGHETVVKLLKSKTCTPLPHHPSLS